ncbi:hypothetical protein [Cysteiniphilum halobium]|uniref:hypothetical protein n=1 Tax=Cysteiniphilum halobium TaxID=2219059 RepID=UPI003F834299
MKIKVLICGFTLGVSTIANANVPHLDPHDLPSLGSLITALNGWEDPLNATSTQAANAETHANNAETTATTAKTQADTAAATANSANTIAQQAIKTVATFDTRLINAETDATDAKSKVQQANVDAQEAKTSAIEAKNKAQQASVDAQEAKTSAIEAKDIATKAKESADKVDQFDQRITNAENNAENAKTTAEDAKAKAQTASDDATKAQQNVDELDQVYSGKIAALNKQINDLNNIIKDEVADRTIKAQDWQSLDELIKLAQTSPHINPKLDADHPVIIKLAPKEYIIDHSIYIPAGIVIDGDNKASLHRYRDARYNDQIILYAPGKLSNLNLINDASVSTNRNDIISAMVELVSESSDTPKYSFTFNNIHYSGGDNSVFVQDNLGTITSGRSYKVKFDHFVSDTERSVIWAAQGSQFTHHFNPADVYAYWFSSAAKGVYISNSTMCISNLANNGSFPPYEDKQILSNVNISNSSVTDYSKSCM